VNGRNARRTLAKVTAPDKLVIMSVSDLKKEVDTLAPRELAELAAESDYVWRVEPYALMIAPRERAPQSR
jgi:hypothetical protein